MNTVFKKMTRALAWVTAVTMSVWMVAPSAAAVTVYKYEWVSQSGTISADGTAHEYQGVTAGQTIPLTLNLLNRSGVTIKGKSALPAGTLQVPVGVWGIGSQTPSQDGTPSFLDLSSFVLNNNRFVYYDGADVPNGGQISFTWNIKMSSTLTNGTYKLYVRPVSEYLAWTRQVKNGYTLPSYNSDIFWQFVVGTGSFTPATGGLSIASSSMTPVSTTVAGGGNANFTRFTLTPASGATVSITAIYVSRSGLSADSDIENVKILDADGVQIGNTAGGFDSNHRAQIFINPALSLSAAKDFYIRAGMISGVTSGKTAALGIAANSDITCNATSVAGAPIWGNLMTGVNVTIGTVTVAEDGSVSDSTPDVGDKDVITNTFKITAGSTENVTVERITVLKAGSAQTSDTENIELWDVTNNKTIATALSWTSDGKASWATNIVLAKGESIRLRVQLDIVDGAGLTTNTDIADGGDYLVFAKGGSYGFYITPTGSWSAQAGGSNNAGQGDYNQTINSGAVVVSKGSTTPPTGNIAVADNQLLTVWDFDVKGEPASISTVVVRGDLAENSGSSVTYSDLTNARLVDMATGNLLSGPVDGADGLATVGTTAVDPKFTFANTFILNPGVTKVGFKVKLGTDWAASDTIYATIYQAADLTIKGQQTNNTITATGPEARGNTQTIKAGALVVRDLGNPPTGAIIVGATDFTLGTFTMDAQAAGEDVLVSSITIGDNVDAVTGNMADINNMELWADLDRNGSYETKISNTEQPDGTAGTDDTQAFTLIQTVRITKGTAINVIIVGDLATGATALGTHAIGILDDTVTAADVTATGADTGSDVAETDGGAAGTLTVTANGSVVMSLDGSSPSSSIVLGATTANTVAKFKFSAYDEPFTVRKINILLANVNGVSQWDAISKITLEYPIDAAGTVGTTAGVPSTTNLQFDNLTMYVPKNDSSILTVKVDLYQVATQSADFGDGIDIGVDADNTGFDSVGLNSGATDTDCGDDTTADTFYVFKTMVTVTADNAGLSSVLVPGATNTLYQFKTTADSRGSVGYKRFTFAVNLQDNGTTSTAADVGGFTIVKDSVDITATNADINGVGGSVDNTTEAARANMETKDTNNIETDADGQVATWVNVSFGNTPTADTQENTPAGGTTVWQFRAQLGAGFSASDDDAVTVVLEGDTNAPATGGTYYLYDADQTAAQYAICLQTEAGVTDSADTEFIWSDNSGYDTTSNWMVHSASFSNASTTETSSGDWWNGTNIKNFPLPTKSIVA